MSNQPSNSELAWKCEACGTLLSSPREQCSCTPIKTSEGGMVFPPRENIGKETEVQSSGHLK